MWEMLDATTTCLYLPSSRNHATVPVTMKRSLYPKSYIRAKTLSQNGIEWDGSTVVLHWKSLAIRGDEDQRVQQTCFNVVDEDLARQAGLRVDILVSCDHILPLLDRTRAPTTKETSSADSSISVSKDDLAAQCPKHVQDDTGRRSPPASPRGSQPQILMLIFNGSDASLNCSRICSSLRCGSPVSPLEDGRLDGCSVQSLSPGFAERESSCRTSTGNRSRNREDQVVSHQRKGWRFRWRLRILS